MATTRPPTKNKHAVRVAIRHEKSDNRKAHVHSGSTTTRSTCNTEQQSMDSELVRILVILGQAPLPLPYQLAEDMQYCWVFACDMLQSVPSTGEIKNEPMENSVLSTC